MNISTGISKALASLRCVTLAVMLPPLAFAGATDLATSPLITIAPGAASVKPNLFFVLDNSGSMNWDYLPDWVVDSTWCKGNTGTASLYCCRNSGGSNITSSTTSSTCLPQNSSGSNLDGNGNSNLRGMPPFHSPDFNSIYYNPSITYAAPKNSDGSSKTSYSGTGSVPWDGYNVQYTSSDTVTLTTGFPDVEWCNGASTTDCLRNDNYLLPGAVGGINYTTMRETTASGTKSFATGSAVSPTTASRNVGPYYYVQVPGEYCSTPKLTACVYATGPTTVSGTYYAYPAKLRWCNNSAGRVAGETGASASDACQSVKNSTYQFPRYPTLAISGATLPSGPTGTITVSTVGQSNCGSGGRGACGTGTTVPPTNSSHTCYNSTNTVTVTSITVGVTQTLSQSFIYCSSSSSGTTRRTGLASAIAARISANGFSASPSTNTVTITAPTGTTYNGAAINVTKVGGTLAYGNMNNGGAAAASGVYVPGAWRRTDIVSGGTFGNTCINASGVVTDRAGSCNSGEIALVDRSDRGDCPSKPNCTYAQELTNFANWFAWYRSRMQMMKSALSTSFVSLDDRFRVGFFTINNSSSNLVNIAPFDTAQKSSWYTKLFAANPNGSTPLRIALANAGRIYAGKISAISGATDPVQYSCQKNFTILSTDGYWNGNNGYQVNGTTEIGNEDSSGMVIPTTGGVTGPFADTYTSTLADVAAHYYKTDLRQSVSPFSNCTGALGAGVNVCANDVPTSNDDKNTAQHMATFTVGLGIPGVMQYRDNYTSLTTDPTDDYSAVKNGTTANPTQGICPWQTTGTCNWPNPRTDLSTERQERIDDLWHAAVDGHAKYYSARDAQALNRGLTDALSSIASDDGGGAAATTSNPNITTGDNFVFSSKFWTIDWTGEFYRETMDETNGTISATANDWHAETILDSASWSSRPLFTFKSGGGTPRSFQWSSLTGTGLDNDTCNPPAAETGCFTRNYINSGLSQWALLSSTDQTAASGINLVNFIRGDQANEDTTTTIGLYRQRKHRLGDIVNSEAFYVGKYLFEYGSGYPTKGTSRTTPSVYVAANDGMLHAFNAGSASSGGGQERWSYIPSMVVKDLHRLAGKNYSHRYFVDGSPVAGDVHDGSTWKTILVGGLAGGGAGFYALDITDQAAPQVLWEFRQKTGCTASTPVGGSRYASSGISRMIEDCDLGYSFGNPVITKIPGGTWVVLVTSGYNNHSGGDGKGYLYVLNAMTGAVMGKAPTGVGDTDVVTAGHGPSGLSKIAAWVDNALTDNTTKYAYGGDLYGNMWKFDLTGCTGSTCSPTVTLLKNVGTGKPITAKPKLGQVVKNNGQKKRVVYFPTGSLLGNDDLATTATQSFFGLWDSDTSSPTAIVTATASSGGAGRVGNIQSSVFENDTNLGWQLDFPDAGERGNTDPALVGTTLVFSTNKPGSSDTCNPSGFTSWIWNIDALSGGAVNISGESGSSRAMATQYSGAATRPNVVVLPTGVVKSITRISGSNVTNVVDDVRMPTSSTGPRRVTWRELQN